jgi:hypothetical protein
MERCLAAEKRTNEAGCAAGKIIVFGILKRIGQVKVFPVSGRSELESM